MSLVQKKLPALASTFRPELSGVSFGPPHGEFQDKAVYNLSMEAALDCIDSGQLLVVELDWPIVAFERLGILPTDRLEAETTLEFDSLQGI